MTWKDRAACRDAEPELFFPDTRTETEAARTRAWCSACPVRTACLEYAMDHGEYGIWGGLSEQERRLEHRRRQRRESMARSRAQQREAS